jgi:hypothetical protein
MLSASRFTRQFFTLLIYAAPAADLITRHRHSYAIFISILPPDARRSSLQMRFSGHAATVVVIEVEARLQLPCFSRSIEPAGQASSVAFFGQPVAIASSGSEDYARLQPACTKKGCSWQFGLPWPPHCRQLLITRPALP